ncbi:MAG: 2-hydroxychromene-2-carboxylate isomerase [Burkholderiales bacterium]
MKKCVDFYFDFGSPTTYLAWTQLPAITAAAGAELNYHPILLGAIFQATGNRSPVAVPGKAVWMMKDIARFAARYRVPFSHNPHFPINTLPLMRGAIGYQMKKPELFNSYVATIFKAIWVDGLNLGDQATLAQLLQASGFDATEFLTIIQLPEVKEKLRTETEAAVQRNVFGAPTFFVGDEMFFGQDRLDFVQEALR